MALDESIQHEQAVWGVVESLDFYRTHRKEPADLYDSERFFLPEVLPLAASVLDVGCAAGGFSRVMRAFNPKLRYVGVDIIPAMVAAAQQDYPDAEFHLSDGVQFPFSPGSFDLVHCSGVLHLNSRYRDMVRAMWEQTRRWLLFDVRLTRGPAVIGSLEVDYGGGAAGDPLPYHVLNVEKWLEFLRALAPPPAVVRGRGYGHAVSGAARVPIDRVIMTFFLLEKGAGRRPRLEIQLED